MSKNNVKQETPELDALIKEAVETRASGRSIKIEIGGVSFESKTEAIKYFWVDKGLRSRAAIASLVGCRAQMVYNILDKAGLNEK